MKNYLLAFLVLLFPVYSFAKDDHLPKKKIYLIEEAERHKNEAIKALKAADEMSVLIPNPEDQKHMHTLIVTTIGSLGSPGDIKTKIIVVGLALIGSLATDVHENYVRYRSFLVSAEHHLQMFRFYMNTSSKLTSRVSDDADRCFCMAIDYLNLTYKWVFVIEHETTGQWDTKTPVAEQLKKLRMLWTSEFMNSAGKPTKRLSEDKYGIHENISEIKAEMEDRDLMSLVFYTLGEAYRFVNIAEKLWGLDKEEAPKKGSAVIIGKQYFRKLRPISHEYGQCLQLVLS